MLHGKILHSTYPHAHCAIGVARWGAAGRCAVLTAADTPT
jgi:hypothetical protein